MDEKNYVNNEEIDIDEMDGIDESISLEDIQKELFENGSPEEQEVIGLKLQIAEANDRFLRLAAEYDNFRRRSVKEKDTTKANAVSDCISAFLPVYDNLERAVKQETADADYKKGVEMTLKIMTEALAKLGVTPVECAVGTTFDPQIHNAMMKSEESRVGQEW